MLKIAVLDDEIKYIEKIREITRSSMEELGFEYELRGYTDPDKFLEDLKEKDHFNIYLLDVEMPKMSGLDVAREIRENFQDSRIIYITNHVQYAVEAFEVNAYRYIPKRYLEEKLPEAYGALGQFCQLENEKIYVIESITEAERIPYREIYYLRKEGKYVEIVHMRGESRVRKTLSDVLQELDSEDFLLIDRSFVVNIRHITSLKQQQILLKNGSFLPVSKPRLKEVKQELLERWRK